MEKNQHELIREMKQLRKENLSLEKSLKRCRTEIEMAVDAIFLGDDQGNFTGANIRASVLSGYPREELIGMNISRLFSENERKLTPLRYDLLKKGKTVLTERSLLRKDGTAVPIEMHSRMLPDGTCQTFIRDVTERKRKKQHRLEERRQQYEKMQAVGQLAGGIAHFFNNQLSGVLGFADMLISSLHDDKLRGYAKNIKISAERSADLTQQLLAFSRKGKHLSVPVSVNRILGEVVSALEGRAGNPIQIRQIFNAEPALVLGDPTQLQSAFLNIAINACDAMPEGGELLFETAVETLDKSWGVGPEGKIAPGKFLKVSLTDSGCGMDEETRKHVFEPFYTTREVGRGTGMGLAGVYGTVRSHKGLITVDSEVGRGSTFNIYLPLAEDVSDPRPGNDSAPVTGSARILLVDDEEMVRGVAAEMLRTLGYEVTECKSGKEALEYYRESWKQIDLVILDMIMPGLDGRETFAAMRKANSGIRAILCSGYSTNGKAQAILDEGIIALIGKPFRLSSLSETVAQALNGTTGLEPRSETDGETCQRQ